MRHYTTKQVQAFLHQLQNGIDFCGIRENKGFGHIYLTAQNNIGWEHYGRSANKPTVDGLQFVIETIFNDCDEIVPAVWSDYHINWIPMDVGYEGFDRSSTHPNVLGL